MLHATGLLETAVILVVTAFVLVTLFARLGVPSLLGYLAAGFIAGPSGLGLIHEGEGLATVGELGVILLLFMLGLEFSWPKLVSLRRLMFGLGLMQVLVTGGLVAAGIHAFAEVPPVAAVLIGGGVAMSSTALTVKVLAGAGALGSPAGRAAVAVLLFQDFAAVFLIVFHDAAAGHGGGEALLIGLAGLAALALALVAARGPLQRFARWIEQSGDPELAQLLALAIALLSAIAAIRAGLSPALGAFVAGMIISEGDAKNVVEREIRPFRDLAMGVFFVAIGTQLDLSALTVQPAAMLGWFALLTIAKFALTLGLARIFIAERETVVRLAAILAHGGEFGLMIVSVGSASGLIPAELAAPLLLALGLSMILAAVVVRLAAGPARGASG